MLRTRGNSELGEAAPWDVAVRESRRCALQLSLAVRI